MNILGWIFFLVITTLLFVLEYRLGYKNGYKRGYSYGYTKGHMCGYQMKDTNVSQIFKNATRLEKVPEIKMEDK